MTGSLKRQLIEDAHAILLFEVEIPGLKERSEELLRQRHYWYIDQEINLELFKLNVCVDDEDFRQAVEDFFTAEHQVYQSASIFEKK